MTNLIIFCVFFGGGGRSWRFLCDWCRTQHLLCDIILWNYERIHFVRGFQWIDKFRLAWILWLHCHIHILYIFLYKKPHSFSIYITSGWGAFRKVRPDKQKCRGATSFPRRAALSGWPWRQYATSPCSLDWTGRSSASWASWTAPPPSRIWLRRCATGALARRKGSRSSSRRSRASSRSPNRPRRPKRPR